MDELIRIAFLEQDYTEQAKALARTVLAKRGLKITAPDIEQVRLRMEEEKRGILEHSLRHLESEDAMPNWRRSLRARIAPYRKLLSLVALVLMMLAWLNGIFDWGLMNLRGRKSEAVALFFGSLLMLFITPSREDYLRQDKDKKKQASGSN